MNFPNKLIVTFKSSNNGAPIPNFAIYLSIRAPRKNNYDIGLRITDKLGQVIFTEQEIKEEIEWTKDSYIMDYVSTYEECFSDFSVILFSKEGIQKCLQHLTTYKKFDERYVKDFELIQQASNTNSAKQQWDFDADKLDLKNGVACIECLVDGS